MSALRSEWLLPRVFALLSALSTVALFAYPLVWGVIWAMGPWLLAASLLGWISHEMCDTIRKRRSDERTMQRRMARSMNVWVLPIDPLRVSNDPDVSLLARVLATPDRAIRGTRP